LGLSYNNPHVTML